MYVFIVVCTTEKASILSLYFICVCVLVVSMKCTFIYLYTRMTETSKDLVLLFFTLFSWNQNCSDNPSLWLSWLNLQINKHLDYMQMQTCLSFYMATTNMTWEPHIYTASVLTCWPISHSLVFNFIVENGKNIE